MNMVCDMLGVGEIEMWKMFEKYEEDIEKEISLDIGMVRYLIGLVFGDYESMENFNERIYKEGREEWEIEREFKRMTMDMLCEMYIKEEGGGGDIKELKKN